MSCASTFLMLHITPETYIQVRRMKGISCETSGVLAASLAMTIDSPVLNIAWSTSAGIASSQLAFGYSPKQTRMTISAPIENSSCCSCWTAYAIGSEARGKCRARTRPRLPLMARVPVWIELLVNVQMKTPVTRNGMKSGTPWLVPSRTPKMK